MSKFPSTFTLSSRTPPLQLWGGLECTIARIGDDYRNQIDETGHHARDDDVARIARLGIRTLRYPVLWESISPDRSDQADWQWHDRRLAQLREAGITPIAGLVHHGSGPRYTSLADPKFPALLAAHAAAVAQRYPWLTMFTPVNEPLTTARFSGLYGHWYPHARNQKTFLQTLVHQCLAVVLSMRAIRRVRPDAVLVQTDDLGKAFSTPILSYQADYENERRWLSFDLLCGKVDHHHPFYDDMIAAGISAATLAQFRQGDSVPDILGINHYLTSERFLDHRTRYYPEHAAAYNGRHHYVDIEAMRMDFPAGWTGPQARLREAWQRYGRPMAVTEAHHGNAREEQLRWLLEVWDAAQTLRREGVDLLAVTVWSLFGCIDWNTLLLEHNQCYETGVFDIRCDPPRPTALAQAVQALNRDGDYDHPVLDQAGWWRRDNCLQVHSLDFPRRQRDAERRVLITGKSGTLGQAFARICDLRGIGHVALARSEMDITDRAQIRQCLMAEQPWAVINTAGYVRVAQAEQEPQRCLRENADGAHLLAQVCAELGIAFVTFSSDLVFDGTLGRAYVESDTVNPVSTYGRSKVLAEQRVQAASDEALIIRSSAFFGPWDRYNFLYSVLRDLSAGMPVIASDDLLVSPTYVPDLVHETLDLLIDGAQGIWHVANRGEVSWHALAARVARGAELDPSMLKKARAAPRRVTALRSERGHGMPTLDSALERFLRECRVQWRNEANATALARD